MTNDNRNNVEIALLKQEVAILKEDLIEIKTTLKEVVTQLNLFNTTIKTGKWIVVSLLLSAGALGHKGITWASQFITGN